MKKHWIFVNLEGIQPQMGLYSSKKTASAALKKLGRTGYRVECWSYQEPVMSQTLNPDNTVSFVQTAPGRWYKS